jgi:predicted ATPase
MTEEEALCGQAQLECRFVVLTGGPGAGKTAVLETAQRHFCQHIVVLPEAAGIIYRGGFARRPAGPVRRAAQRAIHHVQCELERMTREEGIAAVALCDRGTVDGLAYWPDSPESYWRDLGTSLEAELARYAAVIHLRTPRLGYNHHNPLRIESASEAAEIDARIARAWALHPRRFFVDSTTDFLDKAQRALALIRAELPPCCRTCRACDPSVVTARAGTAP